MIVEEIERKNPSIEYFPKIKLIEGRTPILKLDALEANIRSENIQYVTNPKLWLKSEALSGQLFGGNKIRNLEYLLNDAKKLNAKKLVTFGSIESNHALATTIYGREYGFNIKLYLCNLSKKSKGKLSKHIKRLENLGAEVIIVSPAQCSILSKMAGEKIYQWYFPKEEYVIPIGGATPLGCMGHFHLAKEIKNQIDLGELPSVDRIFVPIGSGGTISGLIAGFKYLNLPIKITGVYISKGVTRRKIEGLATKIFSKATGSKTMTIDSNEILTLEKGYKGYRYGACTTESRKAKENLYYTENVELDSTYTAKTMAAFIDYAKNHTEETLLFLQTCNCRDIVELNYSIFEPYLYD